MTAKRTGNEIISEHGSSSPLLLIAESVDVSRHERDVSDESRKEDTEEENVAQQRVWREEE